MIARPLQAVTPTCPRCRGMFETCRCVGGHLGVVLVQLAPRAGIADDAQREDDRSGHDGSGYERDETDQLHQLVARLVAAGDDRAQAAGRGARRTLAGMAPGYTRQPVLRMTRPLPMRGAEDACGVCGRWICTPPCPSPAPSVASTGAVA
ncbi:hypothetical protein OIE60_35410 (plasmid) [Streptomyces sp. NBC_01766]|nr:hypothetical protein [Streptomyces sp. NBC_01766]WSC25087.1 hypothetical protein OIE60_35410 [Streptomyces sp. NBC_01766]